MLLTSCSSYDSSLPGHLDRGSRWGCGWRTRGCRQVVMQAAASRTEMELLRFIICGVLGNTVIQRYI